MHVCVYIYIYTSGGKVLKKHTQVKVPLHYKKCSVSRVKSTCPKNDLSKSKKVAYLKVLKSSE